MLVTTHPKVHLATLHGLRFGTGPGVPGRGDPIGSVVFRVMLVYGISQSVWNYNELINYIYFLLYLVYFFYHSISLLCLLCLYLSIYLSVCLSIYLNLNIT
jgi:hypothetical protein